jgi:hypothetical protein
MSLSLRNHKIKKKKKKKKISNKHLARARPVLASRPITLSLHPTIFCHAFWQKSRARIVPKRQKKENSNSGTVFAGHIAKTLIEYFREKASKFHFHRYATLQELKKRQTSQHFPPYSIGHYQDFDTSHQALSIFSLFFKDLAKRVGI